MRAANWRQLAAPKGTQENRTNEEKRHKRVKDMGSRWLTNRRSRRVDWELAQVSHTCSPDTLSSQEYSSQRTSRFVHTQNCCCSAPGDSEGSCGGPVIAFTLQAWQLATWSLCDDTGQGPSCWREVRNTTFHHNVSEMTPTKRTVDALISSPRCERCWGLDNIVHRMTWLPGLLSRLIKHWQQHHTWNDRKGFCSLMRYHIDYSIHFYFPKPLCTLSHSNGIFLLF